MNQPLTGFTDIHCHILPACDDGPADLDESLKMACCYAEAGVREVIATPHHIPGTAWALPAEQVRAKVEILRQAVKKRGLDLTIHSGMEIALHKNIERGLDSGTLLPLAESDYYLLEPDFHGLSNDIFDAIHLFQTRHKKVVLAHPERVRIFQNCPEKLVELVRQDLVQVQVNMGSLLGRFGNDARKTALLLHRNNSIHYLASDAHGAERRRPPTPALWAKLGKAVGERLETYCITHPNQLVNPPG